MSCVELPLHTSRTPLLSIKKCEIIYESHHMNSQTEQQKIKQNTGYTLKSNTQPQTSLDTNHCNTQTEILLQNVLQLFGH